MRYSNPEDLVPYDLDRIYQLFFEKGQIVNILGFVGHMIFVTHVTKQP